MRLNDCQLGDAYQDEKRKAVIQALGDKYWKIQEGDYLSYVKHLTPRWPQLELLADFMEVGTVPSRWCIFPGEDDDAKNPSRYAYPDDMEEREEEQQKRAEKINVALIKYKSDGTTELERFQSENIKTRAKGARADLVDAISEANVKNESVKFSLFVVEDLSRDVIETLGAGFAIDPHFFRTHIIDYVWNNIRDRWREQPLLDIVGHRKDWFQMRFVHSRYFSNQRHLQTAKSEMNSFNIFRRMDADRNQIFWDKDPAAKIQNWLKSSPLPYEERVDAKVGHTRSKATFWLRDNGEQSAVGVVLLEPTPRTGCPLWRGYANWDATPKFDPERNYDTPPSRNDPDIPPSKRDGESKEPPTWFEDYIFWAQRPGSFPTSLGIPAPLDSQTWLGSSYSPTAPNSPPLIPIHTLLHLVCTEWLTFADYLNARLNQIDWGIAKPSFFPDTDDRKESLEKLHFWRRWVPQARDMLAGTMRQVFSAHHPSSRLRSISKIYEHDYKLIIERLNEYESRIDRLSTVVNSVISLDDARNTFNLTILASLFIPPSLIAAIFSMTTSPLSDLYAALKCWGIASGTALVLLFGFYYLASKEMKDVVEKAFKLSQLKGKFWKHLASMADILKHARTRKGDAEGLRGQNPVPV